MADTLKNPEGFRGGDLICTAESGRLSGRDAMEDSDILSHINRLAGEEHALWEKESRGEATPADQSRLKQIQATLDQCWDYLNQRRALRDAHRNPEEAQVRDSTTIQRYVR